MAVRLVSVASLLRQLLVVIFVTMLLALAFDLNAEPRSIPRDDDETSLSIEGISNVNHFSEGGLYRVKLQPSLGTVTLGSIHAWTIEVETVEGKSFRPIRLAFSGGMPRHQHGFVTSPRITRAFSNNKFLIEGVKFHMPGDWRLKVELVGPSGTDVAIFQIQVGQ